MPEHFNGLTPAEAERLAMLSEECGEVIQVIGKILRHGYDSKYGGLTNREKLLDEYLDIIAVVNLMNKDFNPNGVNQDALRDQVREKTGRKLVYSHHLL